MQTPCTNTELRESVSIKAICFAILVGGTQVFKGHFTHSAIFYIDIIMALTMHSAYIGNCINFL